LVWTCKKRSGERENGDGERTRFFFFRSGGDGSEDEAKKVKTKENEARNLHQNSSSKEEKDKKGLLSLLPLRLPLFPSVLFPLCISVDARKMLARLSLLGATRQARRRWSSSSEGFSARSASSSSSTSSSTSSDNRPFPFAPRDDPVAIPKLLISNRGEIACRIIHTARRLGEKTERERERERRSE